MTVSSSSLVKSSIQWFSNLPWEDKTAFLLFIGASHQAERFLAQSYKEQYDQLYRQFSACIYSPKTVIDAAKIFIITVCATKIFSILNIFASLGIATATFIITANKAIKEISIEQVPPPKQLRKHAVWLPPKEITADELHLTLSPNEIIQQVFNLLQPNPKDLGNLASVCKQWYFVIYSPENIKTMFSRFITDSSRLTKDYRDLFLNNLDPCDVIQFFATKLPEELSFSMLEITKCNLPFKKLVPVFANRQFTHITHLSVSLDLTPELSTLSSLVELNSASLISLKIDWLSFNEIQNSDFFKQLKLKSLAITSTIISKDNFDLFPTNLESLDLSNSSFNEAELNPTLLQKITSIHLSHHSITGLSLVNLPSHLQVLSLKNCRSLEEKYLTVAFSRMTLLHSIDLSSTNITGESLTKLSKEVQIVHLMSCKKLSEGNIHDFLSQQNRKIKNLSLRMTFIAGSCLKAIPSENQLFDLDLAYCSKLEEKELSEGLMKLQSLRVLHLDRTVSHMCTNFSGKFLQHITSPNMQTIFYSLHSDDQLPEELLPELKNNISLFRSQHPNTKLYVPNTLDA